MEEETFTADMSDDDIAASLGFATTLSEGLLPQDAMEEGEETETAEEAPEEDTDKDQDKKIAELEAKIDQLLNEDEEGTDTGTEE